jgi:HAMP domain-containing protein
LLTRVARLRRHVDQVAALGRPAIDPKRLPNTNKLPFWGRDRCPEAKNSEPDAQAHTRDEGNVEILEVAARVERLVQTWRDDLEAGVILSQDVTQAL